jgi:MFS family permease
MTASYTGFGPEPATEHPEDVENQNHAAQNGHSHPPGEDQPLLQAPELESWVPPPGFLWIEATVMANVFLYGFDTTITASTYAVISSDFGAANTASWLTTSYLATSTAFQPLYGRFSDIFGRRVCFIVSTVTFSLGCLGCGVAGNIVLLNCMRALAGFGGGGLMTMGSFNPGTLSIFLTPRHSLARLLTSLSHAH